MPDETPAETISTVEELAEKVTVYTPSTHVEEWVPYAVEHLPAQLVEAHDAATLAAVVLEAAAHFAEADAPTHYLTHIADSPINPDTVDTALATYLREVATDETTEDNQSDHPERRQFLAPDEGGVTLVAPLELYVPQSIYTEADTPYRGERDWNTKQHGRAHIYYEDAAQDDLGLIVEALDLGDEIVSQSFPFPEDHEFEVYLRHPEAMANPEMQSVRYEVTEDGDGFQFLSMEVAAPSPLNIDEDSMLDCTTTESYTTHGIVHEYIEMALQVLETDIHGNERVYPHWFRDGIAELLYVLEAPGELTTRYSARITQRSNVLSTNGFTARSLDGLEMMPYTGGAMFIAYILDEYGWETVLQILLADETNFETTLLAVLDKQTIPGLLYAWETWLEQGAGPMLGAIAADN